MNIVKTDLEGVLIIEPRLFRDARGYFFESFSEREFEEKVAPILGHSVHFCQDNESMPVLHPKGFCSWFCRFLRNCRLPVQV